MQVREEGRDGGDGGVQTRIVSCDAAGGWISWGFAFLGTASTSADAGVRLGSLSVCMRVCVCVCDRVASCECFVFAFGGELSSL